MKKRKISRNIVGVIFSIIICITGIVFSCTNKVYAVTQSEFDQKMSSLRSKYPNYSTWTGTFNGGKQCYGFAHMIGNDVFGSLPSSWTKVYSIDSVKVGDLIQYGNTSGSGHTIFVTGVSGNTITFLDCNGNGNYSGGSKVRTCGIKWDNTIQKNAKMFKKYSFSYLLSSPGISPDVPKPSNPRISKNQDWYDLNDTIEITAYADNATRYYMSMYKDDQKIVAEYVECGKYVLKASVYGTGKYSAYFSGINDAGYVDTPWVDCYVVGKPEYAYIQASAKTYNLSDTVTLSLSAGHTKWQVIGIDRIGTGRIITENTGETYSIAASKLGAGKYSSYFSAYNGSGYTDTSRVEFSILCDNHSYTSEMTKQPTCTETGIRTYICTVCGASKSEEVQATGHQHTEIRNAKQETADEDGYTGDTYCRDCNTKLSSGTIITKQEPGGRVNIGTDFYAWIINTSSGKMLTNSNDDVRTYSENGDSTQVWKFERYDDGAYQITSVSNGKALDVSKANSENGTNVQVWEINHEWAQRWFIYGSQGNYSLRPECAPWSRLDIDGVYEGEDGKVQIWEKLVSTAQNFTIQEIAEPLVSKQDIGDNFYAYITNVEAERNLANEGFEEEVVIRAEKGDLSQIWHFEKRDDGSYKITSIADGNALDVDYGETISGARLQVWRSNDENWQRWYIYEDQGAYLLRAKSGLTLVNIADNATHEGAKTNMWAYHGGNAERFYIRKIVLCDSVSLNCANKTLLGTGAIFQLNGAVSPVGATNKTLTWSSSNTAVATVDSNGLVTAVGAGSATITATTQDGSNVSATCEITVCELLTVTGKASLSEVTEGNSVTISANATGGTGDYIYSFLIHNLENDNWYRWAFDKNAELVWTARGSGSREFFAEVKDAAGTVVRSSAMKVTVKSAVTPLAITGKVSTSQVAAGKTVTISANAIGGTGSYTYSFLIHNLENDSWYRWAFDKSVEHIWTANGSGNREFFAEVKDTAGTVVRSTAMKVMVGNSDSTEKLQILALANKNQIAIGSTVTIRGLAAGGTGSYTYSFLVHNLTNDSWYRFGDFAEAFSYTWTAGNAGTREFFAEVKDSNGTVVRSSAIVIIVK